MQHPDEALPAQVVDAFLTASRALVGVSARSLADADVTLPQFRALVVVGGRDRVTVSRFAEQLGIHPSTATRLCDRLVRKGLIRRTERHTDRRETEIVLTAAGRAVVEHVTARRRTDVAAIVARMSPGDLRQAIAGLTAFADAAGEVPEAAHFGWPEPPEAPDEPEEPAAGSSP